MEGRAASVSFARVSAGNIPHTEADEVRVALLAYCERDDEAMVRVFEALLHVEESRPG